jgi:hypothetical protein
MSVRLEISRDGHEWLQPGKFSLGSSSSNHVNE